MQIVSGHFDEHSQHDTGNFRETAGDLSIDANNTAWNTGKSGLLVSRPCAAIAIHKRAAAAVTPTGPTATVRQFRDDRTPFWIFLSAKPMTRMLLNSPTIRTNALALAGIN